MSHNSFKVSLVQLVATVSTSSFVLTDVSISNIPFPFGSERFSQLGLKSQTVFDNVPFCLIYTLQHETYTMLHLLRDKEIFFQILLIKNSAASIFFNTLIYSCNERFLRLIFHLKIKESFIRYVFEVSKLTLGCGWGGPCSIVDNVIDCNIEF